MKFTLDWLSEYLDITVDLEEITQKLTSIGFEVEEVINKTKILADFTVAEIVEASPHPNADKLKICKVNDGNNILQIVCGASNARAGIKVVLAPIGAIIPENNMTIKKSKIRDIESQGMLCSASELMLGENSDVIIEVDPAIEIGGNYAKLMNLDDIIIDISITPNRGDCLGVYGIARELAAAGCGHLKEVDFKQQLSEDELPIDFKIEIDLCQAYIGLYISDIKQLVIPTKYEKRLKECGFNLHSPIINLTNYITHSFNRPIHVFDADKIKGELKIKQAKDKIKFQALNEVEYILDSEDIIIEDLNEVVALAGIIGGKNSSVSEDTNNVLIEIAIFDDISITKTGRKHNIITDARYRFERKLDNRNLHAIAALIADEIQKFAPQVQIKQKSLWQKPAVRTLDFDLNKVQKILGFDIDYKSINNILSSLGFIIARENKSLKITIPSWRNDIEIPEDIIEEIIRIYGFDKIDPIDFDITYFNDKNFFSNYNIIEQIRSQLANRGLTEIISWSFISKLMAENFCQINENLTLLNPVSKELNYMRPSIVPGMLDIICKNSRRGFSNLSLYEIGNVYLDIDKEVKTICAIRVGKKSEKNLYKDDREFDVFDIKADLTKTLELLNYDIDKLSLDYNVSSYLHPYRSANLFIGKNLVGYFGQIHPNISNKYGIKSNIYVFEIYIDKLPNKNVKKIKYSKSDYQIVKRDFAFIFPQELEAKELIKLVKSIDDKLIKNVKIFDIYQGSKLEANKKSVAFNIVIQADDRTLTDLEINSISNKIEDMITKKLNGKLRDE